MICRLKVDGIKNLVDAEIRLGPLVCFAGPNGAGKSNVIDVLALLSSLSSTRKSSFSTPRQYAQGRAEYRDLFTVVGEDHAIGNASIEVDFVLPQNIPREWLTLEDSVLTIPETYSPAYRFLRYRIEFRYDPESEEERPIYVIKESLEALPFTTVEDAVKGDTRLLRGEILCVRDSGSSGAELTIRTSIISLPLLDAGERSMDMPFKSRWLPFFRGVKAVSLLVLAVDTYFGRLNLYHFEPSKLRQPSDLGSQTQLSASGRNLPAFLARVDAENPHEDVYSQISRRIAALVDDVKEIWVERDEIRELQVLQTRSVSGAVHDARALSDGTLRLIAYAALELGPGAGVSLLEQPEDGIHPGRLPAVASLLKGMAWDPKYPEGDDNPLRQVIVTTHSPTLVAQIPDDSLIFVTSVSSLRNGRKFYRARFKVLPDTWRAEDDRNPSNFISRGELYSYLNPLPGLEEGDVGHRLADTADP